MQTSDIVSEVVDITRKLTLRGNVLICKLIKDSEYFKKYIFISIEKIKKEQKYHPGLIQFWLNYSEDQRTSNGWYLKKDKNVFIVGKLSKISEKQFLNDVDACALFIKNEIEEIREL